MEFDCAGEDGALLHDVRKESSGAMTRIRSRIGPAITSTSPRLLLIVFILTVGSLRAQEMQPRAYLPAPVGLNFIGIGTTAAAPAHIANLEFVWS